MMDPEKNARLSVRRVLPGMVNVEKSASTGIVAGPQVKKLLRNASTNKGCVKVQIKELVMVGKDVGSQNLVQRDWTSKFDALDKFLEDSEPSYLAFWRDDKDCLLVSFIPENVKPRDKMLYASTRGSLKDAIQEIDPEVVIEEYNVNEIKDVNSEKYNARSNIPKPYTDYEKEKMEEDKQEIGGGYGFLAHLIKIQNEGENPKPIALPGLGAAAAAIAKGKKDGRLDIKDAVKHAEKVQKEEEEDAAKKLEAAKETDAALTSEEIENKKMNNEVEEEETKDDEHEEKIGSAKVQVVPEESSTEKEKDEERNELGSKQHEKTVVQQTKEDLETEVQEEIKSLAKIAGSNEVKNAPEKTEIKGSISKKKTNNGQKKVEHLPVSKVVPPIKHERKESAMKTLKNSYKFFKEKVLMGKGKDKVRQEGSALTEEQLAKYPDNDGRHSLAELQEKVKLKQFGDLDKDTIEQYLSSREFFRTFHVDKVAFKDLPGWKKKRLKESAQLF